MRTTDEIRARLNDPARAKFLFDFGEEVLSAHLPENWEKGLNKEHLLNDKTVKEEAVSYLRFAFDKALHHRGISASRSVQKMREYAWLLGLDEAVKFSEQDGNYTNYGVPILKNMAKALGVEIPKEIASWEDGQPCYPGCNNGCGK